MTAATDVVVASGGGLAAQRATRNARIRAVLFAAFGLVAFYFASQSPGTSATFSFWIDEQGGQSATLQTSVGVLWVIAGLASWFVAILQLLRGAPLLWRPWLLLLVWPWVVAILAAVLDGKPANLTGMISGSLEFAVPITLGALAGILSERSGMLNIALEGKMLVGACVASVAASVSLLVTGNALVSVFIGIASAMLVSGGVGILLAWMGIRHKMDQIIAGTVINIGAVGITNFLFLRVLSRNTQLNTPPTIEPWRIPLLAEIPVLGPIFFAAKPYVYVMYALVAILTYMLFRTQWGLRLRASGEKPAAAGTVGIDVIAIRYRSLFYAGLIAGLAGSYLSLSVAGNFGMQMVAGKGFIALAAMIFGAWHPVGALGAALVFGFAGTTQTLLAILGVNVPPQLLNSVPYLVTIIVVAGVVGRVRGPAAAGQPYEQG
jgi:simple sugar transport system permease protein